MLRKNIRTRIKILYIIRQTKNRSEWTTRSTTVQKIRTKRKRWKNKLINNKKWRIIEEIKKGILRNNSKKRRINKETWRHRKYNSRRIRRKSPISKIKIWIERKETKRRLQNFIRKIRTKRSLI